MEKITKEEWVVALMRDFDKVEGLEQPDGGMMNARVTAEYYWELATKSNPHHSL